MINPVDRKKDLAAELRAFAVAAVLSLLIALCLRLPSLEEIPLTLSMIGLLGLLMFVMGRALHRAGSTLCAAIADACDAAVAGFIDRMMASCNRAARKISLMVARCETSLKQQEAVADSIQKGCPKRPRIFSERAEDKPRNS